MVARIGRQELARRLDVPLAILGDWLIGETIMPDAKLAALIDLVDDTIETQLSGSTRTH